MGEVYLGEEESALRLKVAVKLIPPEARADERLRRLFRREARAMAALTHRNVPRVLELGEEPVPYLVMEFLSGVTLREALVNRGRVEPLVGAFIASEIARAIDAAHAVRDDDLPAGLVHGDLSPSNVMICDDGAVKVLDFGLARPAHTERSVSTVEGKLAWLPPEALSGDIGQSADLYAVGIILYELVTGRQPFSGRNDLETVRNVLAAQAPPVRTLAPDVPEALAAIITHAMARDVAARFPSGEALAAALDAVVARQVDLKDLQRLVTTSVPQPDATSLATLSLPAPGTERPTAEVPPQAATPSRVPSEVADVRLDASARAAQRPRRVVAAAISVALLLGTGFVLTSRATTPGAPSAERAAAAPLEVPSFAKLDGGFAAKPETLAAEFTPAPAMLLITVNVDAAIELDALTVSRGARTARLPVSREGSHRLTVSAPGYRPVERLVVTSAGAVLEIPITLTRSTSGKRRAAAGTPGDDSSPIDPFAPK